MISVMEEALRIVKGLPVLKTCASCVNWMDGRCFAFDAVPPEHVQVIGCDCWDFILDGVPYDQTR